MITKENIYGALVAAIIFGAIVGLNIGVGTGNPCIGFACGFTISVIALPLYAIAFGYTEEK